MEILLTILRTSTLIFSALVISLVICCCKVSGRMSQLEYEAEIMKLLNKK